MLSASPVVPWIGGKRRLATTLLARFPAHTCYVEPCCGAAAVFFAKPPSEVEVLNDINGELVRLYRVLQHHLDEFLRQFRWALTSRQMFLWAQQTPPETLTDIQRAARFFFLQHQAFGGKVAGQTFGTSTTHRPTLNLLRLEEQLSAAHLRLAGALIEHLDWATCVAKYDRPHTLFYLDPPYWETEGYGVPFPLEAYEQMAALARSIAGQMVISINDHPTMRKVFAGLPMERLEKSYSLSRKAEGRGKRGELVIRNR
ncbi:MAG: DNA adenine methylase [Gemmatimonadales bacterium]|nr:DNA adenine methylase [Gemmatimonadales bacterium]